ncbi:hypothetical protein NDU88_005721 [Pleurodeles waltl]|uniref:Uncharacterized protein n=1 Tax=Pleurodeles waltl TaxID=8319 RepID=A0AAV7L1N0_PLEWA|nr:hypothetical protein NDU88_005721 [Pleurodeles waltl]
MERAGWASDHRCLSAVNCPQQLLPECRPSLNECRRAGVPPHSRSSGQQAALVPCSPAFPSLQGGPRRQLQCCPQAGIKFAHYLSHTHTTTNITGGVRILKDFVVRAESSDQASLCGYLARSRPRV